MDKNKEKEIKDFLNFIIAEAKSKGKDPNAYAKELGEDGMKEAYKRFQALKLKKAQKAAHGAKLQYFRTLKNQCADDEELYYYKKGGSVGCGCKKKEDGGEVKKECGGGAVSKFKKMRQGGQPKVVNGSTKQPTIQGTAKMQEERKANENMTWDPKLKKMRKMTSEEIARTKKNQADARRGEGEGEPQHKCGGKVKKHQEGSIIAKFKKNRQGGKISIG